jgi:hypothetical protein
MNSLDLIGYRPNSAPFSIFPFRARTCIDLLIGAKFYVSFLNVNAVERDIIKRGWTIEKDFKTLMKENSKGAMVESMLDVQKGPFTPLLHQGLHAYADRDPSPEDPNRRLRS